LFGLLLSAVMAVDVDLVLVLVSQSVSPIQFLSFCAAALLQLFSMSCYWCIFSDDRGRNHLLMTEESVLLFVKPKKTCVVKMLISAVLWFLNLLTHGIRTSSVSHKMGQILGLIQSIR
jgi:hypothetical protein